MSAVVDAEVLTEVWRSVLRDPAVDAGDSFLDSGGSSLTAVRLKVQIAKVCGLDVDIVMLVENPSPEALYLALEAEAGAT